MRKGTLTVIRAFEHGVSAHPSRAIWTDGTSIYSYDTCLLTGDPVTGEFILNRSSYTNTTSQHQTALAVYFRPAVVLHGLRWGVRPDALKVLAAIPATQLVPETHPDYVQIIRDDGSFRFPYGVSNAE